MSRLLMLMAGWRPRAESPAPRPPKTAAEPKNARKPTHASAVAHRRWREVPDQAGVPARLPLASTNTTGEPRMTTSPETPCT